MSHGRDQPETIDHNRIDLSWLNCNDCKESEDFLCGNCYASYKEECGE